MYFYKKIAENRHFLNSNEEIILQYFFDNKDTIQSLTITKASKDNFVVPNTIIRCCKKLGFSGYSEFKDSFFIALNQEKDQFESISLDSQLNKTKELINEKIINSIIDAIHDSERIIIIGLGLSKNAATDFNDKLQILGLNSNFYSDHHVIEHHCKFIKKGSLAIIFSISGETLKIINYANIIKSCGSTIISITGFSNNTLSKISDFQLYSMSSPTIINGLDVTSRLGFFYLSNYIFEKYVNKFNF